MRIRQNQKKVIIGALSALMVLLFGVFAYFFTQTPNIKTQTTTTTNNSTLVSQQTSQSSKPYTVSEDEKNYLNQRFTELSKINPETIGYVYIPNTPLDEPVVQTTDNETYLDKTFEGNYQPLMGSVYMDKDNNKGFSDKLTWLFGHARGSKVPDYRMFKVINYYDTQEYFDANRFVVIETPERKYYYQAAFFIIVPENTAFYKTEFANDIEFVEQLSQVKTQAVSFNPDITIQATDRYLVLSTCREYDDTIRANLYLRQIPDSELEEFLAKYKDQLVYKPTR